MADSIYDQMIFYCIKDQIAVALTQQEPSEMTSIFDYRGLIWNFIKRDISSKYVGSLLGLYWSILNPIIFLVVYIIVFGVFLNVRLPGTTSIWDFALYFAAGFLPWLAFQDSVMRASRSIIDNKNYIKKVPFPSEIFPVLYHIIRICKPFNWSRNLFDCCLFILKGTLTIYITPPPAGHYPSDSIYLIAGFFPFERCGLFSGYPHNAGSFVYDMVLGDTDCIHSKSYPGKFPMDSQIESCLLYD